MTGEGSFTDELNLAFQQTRQQEAILASWHILLFLKIIIIIIIIYSANYRGCLGDIQAGVGMHINAKRITSSKH